MSSPGAGKTTTLIKLINYLKGQFKIGVMEADIDSNVDAISVAKETGVKSIQLHTSGMCHLDAGMTKTGLDEIGSNDLDLIFLENVGNLVCPAEFDTGATMDMVILSIPEGDDKPLKYPLIFQKCDLVLINKIDTINYFNFDFDKCNDMIHYRNPNATVINISALTGENINLVGDYLVKRIKEWGGK
jgi:hydrogenase nickel incorporation protein HypB